MFCNGGGTLKRIAGMLWRYMLWIAMTFNAPTSGPRFSPQSLRDQRRKTADFSECSRKRDLSVMWRLILFQRPGQIMGHMHTPAARGDHRQDIRLQRIAGHQSPLAAPP